MNKKQMVLSVLIFSFTIIIIIVIFTLKNNIKEKVVIKIPFTKITYSLIPKDATTTIPEAKIDIDLYYCF